MSIKCDISPIIEHLPDLKGSDVKNLVVLYQNGRWMEPEHLAVETGLNLRTVKKSLKKPIVKHLISCIERRSAIDLLLIQQKKELEKLLAAEKKGTKST